VALKPPPPVLPDGSGKNRLSLHKNFDIKNFFFGNFSHWFVVYYCFLAENVKIVSKMSTKDWIIIAVVAGVGYWWFKTQSALNLNWTLSDINPSFVGSATVLNADVLVTNTSTASVSLTNVNATLYYNGSPLASGGTSATINPGVQTLTIPFTVSDLTILNDVNSALSNSPAAYNFQVKGTGLLNGAPVVFSTSYSVPSSIGSVRQRRKLLTA
jgi:hypothetical protein